MTETRESTIDKLIKNQTDRTHIQFFRYIFVGGAAFLVQFASFIIFTNININYLIATPMAFILGLIANYVLSIRWVFNKRTLDNMWSEFTIFAVIGIVGMILTEIFMWFFVDIVGFYNIFYNAHLFSTSHNLGLYIANIVTAALVLFWNFGARKLTLFR
ncbi:MAG TPA: GtrA family protein [Methanobacterium sp.]|nr:GtrA family protein [Methanobacterium sp.]